MSYRIEYSNYAKKTLEKYKKSNPNAYKKVNALVKELHEHPRTGFGHPKPLVAGNEITYSRHITGKDRIIYDIYDDRVLIIILSLEGHYRDK
jgi:toxin YoeB